MWDWHPPTTLLVTYDIDEALVLADRVIVMGGTPGTNRAEIKVELSRPRAPADKAFHQLQDRAMGFAESIDGRSECESAAGGRIGRRLLRWHAARSVESSRKVPAGHGSHPPVRVCRRNAWSGKSLRESTFAGRWQRTPLFEQHPETTNPALDDLIDAGDAPVGPIDMPAFPTEAAGRRATSGPGMDCR